MPRVAQSCALCGAPLVGKRWKYCEVCCPSGMQVKVCIACLEPFTQPKKGERKTCSEACQKAAWERRPKPKSSFVPFDCTRCGVHVASTDEVKGSAPHLGMQLCGPCKSTMSYAKSLGKTLAEHDADRQVELTCVSCGTTWLHTRRQGHVPKKCESCAPRKDQCRKSTVGQAFDCPTCGAQFVKRSDNQRYCGPGCVQWVNAPVTTEPCQWCGKDVTAKKYKSSRRRFCGRKCQMAYKVCVTDGMPTKPWPRTQPCIRCGREYPTSSWNPARCPDCLSVHLDSLKVEQACQGCGEIALALPGMKWCQACRKRRKWQRKSSRWKERRLYVIERDGGRCQVCKCRVVSGQSLHPRAAEIDHIIPVSLWPKGVRGVNDPANLRLLCRTCNATKSNGAAPRGDQLLLIG